MNFKVISLFVFITLHVAFGQQCPNGWSQFRNKCFWKSDVLAEFDDNKRNCDSMNATMVTIDSEDENAFLNSILAIGNTEIQDWFYLGGKRVAPNTNHFRWFNGNDFRYSNWDKDFPGNRMNIVDENCVFIGRKNVGRWHNWVCNYKALQLCQLYIKTNEEIVREEITDVNLKVNNALGTVNKIDAKIDGVIKTIKNISTQQDYEAITSELIRNSQQCDTSVRNESNRLKYEIANEIVRNTFQLNESLHNKFEILNGKIDSLSQKFAQNLNITRNSETNKNSSIKVRIIKRDLSESVNGVLSERNDQLSKDIKQQLTTNTLNIFEKIEEKQNEVIDQLQSQIRLQLKRQLKRQSIEISLKIDKSNVQMSELITLVKKLSDRIETLEQERSNRCENHVK